MCKGNRFAGRDDQEILTNMELLITYLVNHSTNVILKELVDVPIENTHVGLFEVWSVGTDDHMVRRLSKPPTSPFAIKRDYSILAMDVEVRRMVSKIAVGIWEADHDDILPTLQDKALPVPQQNISTPADKTNYANGSPDLVILSSASTPDEQNKETFRAVMLRESKSFNGNAINHPKTASEFLSLDFSHFVTMMQRRYRDHLTHLFFLKMEQRLITAMTKTQAKAREVDT